MLRGSARFGLGLAFGLLLALPGCRQVFGLAEPSRADAGGTGDGPVGDAQPIDAPPSSITVELTAQASSGDDVNTFEFLAQPIGTPSLDRHLVVLVHGRSSPGYYGTTSLTIDGAEAEEAVQAGGLLADAAVATIFTYRAPTGTTANLKVSYTGGAVDRRCAVSVYAVYGLSSAMAHAVNSIKSPAPASVELEVPAGGIVFAAVSMSTVPSGSTSGWSGLASGSAYVLRVEGSLFAGGLATGIAGTHVITHTSNDQETNHLLAAASFK
jgi:hypothetical protein